MSIIRSMACPNWMILLSFPRLSGGKSLDFGRRFVSSLSGEANDGEPVRAQWKILAGLTPTKEKQDGGEAGAVTHDGDDSTKESGAVSFLSCPAGPSRGIDGCLGYALVVRGGRGSGPGGAGVDAFIEHGWHFYNKSRRRVAHHDRLPARGRLARPGLDNIECDSLPAWSRAIKPRCGLFLQFRKCAKKNDIENVCGIGR
ncbi:hypothetical protein [Paraburkholderia caballeronis]|uniref:hypothetical protein n=1 Tax=Paraburkholderia caballeronis TaxID=416943 RepID=UPI00115FC660|nr:hypothetical protein [Paraburkholderia caballeronis]